MLNEDRAYDDLLRRSLSKIPGDLARLIYLASTRDYNTGTYHHAGLEDRFQPDIAGKALGAAHLQIFHKVAACSLKELVDEVGVYMNASRTSRNEVLNVWQKLEPYRIALPADVHPAEARMFVSNVRLALAILRHQERAASRPAS